MLTETDHVGVTGTTGCFGGGESSFSFTTSADAVALGPLADGLGAGVAMICAGWTGELTTD